MASAMAATGIVALTDHGRARDRAEQVVKGSFHSGASR